MRISDRYIRRSMGAVLWSGAVFLSGCGKPVTAVKQGVDHKVETETGPLPGVGTANRLKNEQSAFLRNHAKDPVDWYPWGEEAFGKAKAEGKLLLVSIGYASCPWTQKMQDDSFTDPQVARFMNRHFVNVLVDREERPDLNNAYLHYAFWKQQQSGWPLHIWLTPDGVPVYTGVYFAKESAGSSASWETTINHVASTWATDRAYVERQAKDGSERYLADYRRRWQVPSAAGNENLKGVAEFMAVPEAERAKRFDGLGRDELQFLVADLPAAELDRLFRELGAERGKERLEQLRPVPAAMLFPKLKDEAWRGKAFGHFAEVLRGAVFEKLRSLYDPVNGGFSEPPKFMQPHNFEFLMRYAVRAEGGGFGRSRAALDMTVYSLKRILAGGINDQLAGGFHRYSTDSYWAVPQFEKMAYDQGSMAVVLTAASQLSGEVVFAEAARRTLEYTMTELSHPGGGFYCAEGSSSSAAGSERLEEGAFYVWEKGEVDKLVGGEAAPLVALMFGLEERGNLPIDSAVRSRLPRANLLVMQKTAEEAGGELGMAAEKAKGMWEGARVKLLEARNKRPRPVLEDKALTSWNGTVISGLARTGFHLGDAGLTDRAVRAAEFVLTKLRRKDGGVIHAFLDGPSTAPGYAEDYAMMIAGLVDLYEATGNGRWLKVAAELQDQQIKELWDVEDSGFFDGPPSAEIFQRIKSMDEATELAAGSVSAVNLVRLGHLTGKVEYGEHCRKIMDRFAAQSGVTPIAFVRFLRAAELAAEPALRVVISGKPEAADRGAMLAVLRKWYRADASLMYLDGSDAAKELVAAHPFLKGQAEPGEGTVVHVCRGEAVVKSAATPAALGEMLNETLKRPAAQ